MSSACKGGAAKSGVGIIEGFSGCVITGFCKEGSGNGVGEMLVCRVSVCTVVVVSVENVFCCGMTPASGVPIPLLYVSGCCGSRLEKDFGSINIVLI